MSGWETALDRVRRVHRERTRQVREEKYAAKEPGRAKVDEARYRDRAPVILRGRCAEGEWNVTTKSGTAIYDEKSGTYKEVGNNRGT